LVPAKLSMNLAASVSSRRNVCYSIHY